MPRSDRNQVIIIEVAIPHPTLRIANIKNKVLIASPSIAGDTGK
jgi:hypothetical protein